MPPTDSSRTVVEDEEFLVLLRLANLPEVNPIATTATAPMEKTADNQPKGEAAETALKEADVKDQLPEGEAAVKMDLDPERPNAVATNEVSSKFARMSGRHENPEIDGRPNSVHAGRQSGPDECVLANKQALAPALPLPTTQTPFSDLDRMPHGMGLEYVCRLYICSESKLAANASD